MEDYKQDIVNSRKGGLGSSDASMVMQVANSQAIGDGASQRIAVMLGIIEKKEFRRNKAMIMGDEIEMKVYDEYRDMFPTAQSNPVYASELMTERYGFSVLNHIDIEVESEGELLWFECKASKLGTDDVLGSYAAQLAWHWMLLDEKAAKLGKTPHLFLLHYPTEGMIDSGYFSIDRLRQVEIPRETVEVDIKRLQDGLAIIAAALPTFKYVEAEEIDAYSLPADTQEALVALKHKIDTIKQYEAEIAEFKESIKEQMEQHGFKSIRCEAFRITYVAEAVKTSFDGARLKKENPELYAQYNNKKSTSKAYVIIK